MADTIDAEKLAGISDAEMIDALRTARDNGGTIGDAWDALVELARTRSL